MAASGKRACWLFIPAALVPFLSWCACSTVTGGGSGVFAVVFVDQLIQVPCTSALAPYLLSRLTSCASHSHARAHPLNPAALAFVPFAWDSISSSSSSRKFCAMLTAGLLFPYTRPITPVVLAYKRAHIKNIIWLTAIILRRVKFEGLSFAGWLD
jgi:hypothetical protein